MKITFRTKSFEGHVGIPGHRGGSAPKGTPRPYTTQVDKYEYDRMLVDIIGVGYEQLDSSGGEAVDAGDAMRIYAERTGFRFDEEGEDEAKISKLFDDEFSSQLKVPEGEGFDGVYRNPPWTDLHGENPNPNPPLGGNEFEDYTAPTADLNELNVNATRDSSGRAIKFDNTGLHTDAYHWFLYNPDKMLEPKGISVVHNGVDASMEFRGTWSYLSPMNTKDFASKIQREIDNSPYEGTVVRSGFMYRQSLKPKYWWAVVKLTGRK